MITVNTFKISTDRTSIQLDITVDVGQVVTDLKLWNENTYKIVSEAIDLNSLIVGVGNTESITITNTQAGVSTFDGIYVVQIESDDSSDVPGLVATFSATRLYGLTAQLLANVDLSCLNCNENFQNAALLDLYIQSIINSIRLGRFRDAMEFLKKINTFEEADCSECSNIAPVVSSAGNLVTVGVLDCELEETS